MHEEEEAKQEVDSTMREEDEYYDDGPAFDPELDAQVPESASEGEVINANECPQGNVETPPDGVATENAEAEAVETLTDALLARDSEEATEEQGEEDILESFMSRGQQPEDEGSVATIEELLTHHRTHKQREADCWLRSTKITRHTDVGFYIAKMIAQRGLRSKISKGSLQDSFNLNMSILAESKEDAGLDEDAKRLRSLNFNTALRHFIKAGEVQLRRVGE